MNDVRRSREALAIVGAEGEIDQSDGGFESLIAIEWPEWRGGALPAALVEEMLADPQARFRGRLVVVDSLRVGERFFVSARETDAIDRLSVRERQIARCLAEGLTHKQVAKIVCLAPATVRNYLQAIYGKLGLRSKAALASLVVRTSNGR